MIVEPVTLGPRDRVADALELMETYHISGIPITDETGRLVGILTNRDLRFEGRPRAADREPDDERGARDRSGRNDARRGARGVAPPPDREASGRRRRRVPEGPDHRQGHPEEDPVPAGDEGRAGPTSRRRPPSALGRMRSSARRRSSRRRSTCSSSTPRTATRRRSSTPCGEIKERFDVQVVAGNIGTVRGDRGSVRGRRRRGEGRRRAGVDLHHPRRRRRRRAPDHRSPRLRPGRARATACP